MRSSLSKSFLKLQANDVHQVGTDSVSHVTGTELSEGELGVDCLCIAVSNNIPANSALALGQYFLYWKR